MTYRVFSPLADKHVDLLAIVNDVGDEARALGQKDQSLTEGLHAGTEDCTGQVTQISNFLLLVSVARLYQEVDAEGVEKDDCSEASYSPVKAHPGHRERKSHYADADVHVKGVCERVHRCRRPFRLLGLSQVPH